MSSESTELTLIRCMRKLLREKPFSKITVGEICEMARISRRSFYRHYNDKYELLKAINSLYIFEKLDIQEGDDFWQIIKHYCHHLYKEKAFYTHVFEVKGQNGFWDEVRNLMEPYVKATIPIDNYASDYVSIMFSYDVYIMMMLSAEWLKEGFQTDPDTFYKKARSAFAIHGKQLYESSMGYPIERITEEDIDREKKW